MDATRLKSGDLLFFTGQGLLSRTIDLCTGGVPGYSHVGIVCRHQGHMLLFESTSVLPPSEKCVLTEKPVKGVQAHFAQGIELRRPGKVYLHPLSRSLYGHEEQRLQLYLLSLVGRPYDTVGAFRSGGVLFGLLESVIHTESLNTIFCSEFAASALSEIGVFPTSNASKYNPNKLARRAFMEGITKPRVRYVS